MASSNEHFTRRLSALRKICSRLHPEIRLRTKRGVHIFKYPVTKRHSGLSPHLAILLRSQARGQQVDRGIRNNEINVTLDWHFVGPQSNQQHTVQHHRHYSGRGRTEMEKHHVKNGTRPIHVVWHVHQTCWNHLCQKNGASRKIEHGNEVLTTCQGILPPGM